MEILEQHMIGNFFCGKIYGKTCEKEHVILLKECVNICYICYHKMPLSMFVLCG